MEKLTSDGYSLAYMERALGLPRRTMTRWRAEGSKISAPALALLKTIRTYPWILEVSENQFDHDIALEVFLRNAVNAFSAVVNPKKNIVFQRIEAFTDQDNVLVVAQGGPIGECSVGTGAGAGEIPTVTASVGTY
jgi:hypothetical protein